MVVAALPVLVWAWLLFARGSFWRSDQRLSAAGERSHWPSVVAVIPARDEAGTIGATVASLLAQDYPGEVRVIVVDDNSTDGTRLAAGTSPDLQIICGKPLRSGWTGKLWAVKQGIDAIDVFAPDAAFILLTDADIVHAPDSLKELVHKAVTDHLLLVSLMVRLRCQTFWERLLIPAFVFFFQKLYPFARVNDPSSDCAAAAGGCILIERQALHRAGGIDAIHDQLIDDCALASLIKPHGPIWLGLSETTVSSRAYCRLSEIWQMVSRTAYRQLDHSPVNLVGTIIAMLIIYLAPPVSVIAGIGVDEPQLILSGAIAWAMMCFAYVPTLRLYNRSLLGSLALPAAAALYTLMTVSSAVQYWRGLGGAWKGRTYSK